MKISPKLEDLINKQIQIEFTSRYAYLAMSAWFETTPFGGFAKWMRDQASEENFHAMKFFDYLNDRFGVVKLLPLDAPQGEFTSPLEAFRCSLKHEQAVTESINNIYAAALEEKDFATMEFLDWFLKEQVEEEKSVQDMIDDLELAGKEPDALLRLDSDAAGGHGEESEG